MIASSKAPITLGRRLELRKCRVYFRIVPHEALFISDAGSIIDKQASHIVLVTLERILTKP